MRSTAARIHDIGVLGLILVSALSCGRDPIDLHDAIHQHTVESDFEFVGEEASFLFHSRTEFTSLRCEVIAPSGAQVPCTKTGWITPPPLPITRETRSGEKKATLYFTPTEVGWHQVIASGEEEQVTLRTYAFDKRHEELARLPRSCNWLERFPDGAWLCDGAFFRLTDAVAQPLGAELTAVGGAAIWTLHDGVVSRVREPLPGEPLSAPEQSLDLGALRAPSLIATPRDLLVIHRNGVIRVTLDELGSLAISGRLDLPLADNTKAKRVGDTLMLGEPLVPWVIGDDADAPQRELVEVCVYSLGQSAITERGCRRHGGLLLGESDEGLLLQDSRQLVAVPSTLGNEARLDLPRSRNGVVASTPGGVVLMPPSIVPHHVGDTLELQWFEGATNASAGLAWSTTSNSTIVWSR